MSFSGVQVAPECVEAFQSLKLGKKYKYVIYKLSSDSKSIEVESTETGKDYDEFLTKLPQDDCRWAVYDFDYSTNDGERSKIVFYTWSPDGAKIRSKMVYASSKDALRKSLNGVAVEIQGTDVDEVAHETVLDRIRR